MYIVLYIRMFVVNLGLVTWIKFYVLTAKPVISLNMGNIGKFS
jgi:hypothetical protein